jgi:hypothetical protein
MKRISTILRTLTMDDLREWAGAKILNRGNPTKDHRLKPSE